MSSDKKETSKSTNKNRSSSPSKDAAWADKAVANMSPATAQGERTIVYSTTTDTSGKNDGVPLCGTNVSLRNTDAEEDTEIVSKYTKKSLDMICNDINPIFANIANKTGKVTATMTKEKFDKQMCNLENSIIKEKFSFLIFEM